MDKISGNPCRILDRPALAQPQFEIMGEGENPMRTLRLGAARVLAAGALCLNVLNPAPSLAQSTAAARPEFEVASVRLNDSGRGGAGSTRQLNPGSLNYTDRSLAEYIDLAYGVVPFQVTHGPDVSLSARYDIAAKAADPVPEA